MLKFNDSSGTSVTSVQHADLEKLEKLVKIGGGNIAMKELAEAGQDRVVYQLDKSNRHAQHCYDDAKNSKPIVAAVCQLFLAGNLYLQGDLQGWASQALEARDLMYGWLANQQNIPNPKMDVFEAFDFSSVKNFPRTTERWTSTESTAIPFHWSTYMLDENGTYKDQKNLVPFIDAELNGHKISMALDTGASDIFMSAGEAQKIQSSRW